MVEDIDLERVGNATVVIAQKFWCIQMLMYKKQWHTRVLHGLLLEPSVMHPRRCFSIESIPQPTGTCVEVLMEDTDNSVLKQLMTVRFRIHWSLVSYACDQFVMAQSLSVFVSCMKQLLQAASLEMKWPRF